MTLLIARRIAVAAISLLAAAAPAAAAPGVSRATHLTVQIWNRPLPAAPARTYRLSCAPAAGTVPHPAAACGRLARLAAPFAPLRTRCQTVDLIHARIRGTFRG